MVRPLGELRSQLVEVVLVEQLEEELVQLAAAEEVAEEKEVEVERQALEVAVSAEVELLAELEVAALVEVEPWVVQPPLRPKWLSFPPLVQQ